MCDSRKDFSDEEEKYSDDRNAGIRKSTIGVLLAKRLGYSFVDVDLVIQEKTGKL